MRGVTFTVDFGGLLLLLLTSCFLCFEWGKASMWPTSDFWTKFLNFGLPMLSNLIESLFLISVVIFLLGLVELFSLITVLLSPLLPDFVLLFTKTWWHNRSYDFVILRKASERLLGMKRFLACSFSVTDFSPESFGSFAWTVSAGLLLFSLLPFQG